MTDSPDPCSVSDRSNHRFDRWFGARPSRVFLSALAVFFFAMSLWSLATPLFASPDEPVQMIKAVAVAHGELLGGQPEGPSSPNIVVHVPELYANAGTVPSCFAFHHLVAASCAPPLRGRTTDVNVTIYTGRYPPLYYVVVGLPSLLTTSDAGVYAMRLMSALINAIFLALAVTSIVVWSRSKMLLIGLGVAVTPEVLFYGGVINPTGLEVTGATCLWCSALVLAVDRPLNPPRGLLAIAAVSACVTTLVHGLSPLWVAMIGLTVVGIAGRQSVVALIRHPSVRKALGAVVFCGIVACVWIIATHTLDIKPSVQRVPASMSGWQILATTFDHSSRFIAEMVGVFGWLDIYSPTLTFLAWYAAIGLIVGLALVMARRGDATLVVLVTLAAILVPVLIATSQVRHSGYVWQGKDSLAYAVGVPLLASAALGRSQTIGRYRRRLTALVLGGLAIASAVAFGGTLRSFAVGEGGPVDFLPGEWRPPLGSLTLMLAEIIAMFAMAGLLSGHVLRDPSVDRA